MPKYKFPSKRFPYVPPQFGKGAAWKVRVKKSVYYWWFEYLKENSDYRETCRNNGEGPGQKIYGHFGDVHKTDFKTWWMDRMRGMELFADLSFTARPNVVVPEELEGKTNLGYRNSIFIEVPMRGSKRYLIKKINEMVRMHHPGRRGIQLARDTKALYVPTGALSVKTLERDLFAYRLKQSSPRLTLWQIACIAPESSRLVMRHKATIQDTKSTEQSLREAKQQLGEYANRWIRQAKKRIASTLEGKFP